MSADGPLESYTPTIVATPRAPEAAPLGPGAVLGRYIVLAPLGAGGMGVVYAAYDPELDRKVALKLLRVEPDMASDASVGRARLLREAQALARLSHPNVVAIHDVGTVGDRVWLAIEYIDGQTFGAWHRAAPRRWQEILAVLLDAGRGLAAAHAAGLVHRDLKPDNIMIGADGRVRVMDFGLARAAGAQEEGAVARQAAFSTLESSVLNTPVTRAGLVIGTPTYMAPEQWTGQPLDARIDQFAFCVTLWEALFGERPFAGETLAELATRVVQGERRLPPSAARVPAWLRRACARGLLSDPERRWPSMTALLAELEGGQARTRNRWIGLGLGLALLAGLAGLAWQRDEHAGRLAACAAAGDEITAVWNDEARAALQAALVGTGVAHAQTTFEKVVPWIDRWTEAWSSARATSCREAEVLGTRSPELYQRGLACLDERREQLVGVLSILAERDPAVLPQAVSMAADLGPLVPCSDRAVLERLPPEPAEPALREQAAQLRRELRRTDELVSAGRFEAALARAEAVLPVAEQLGHGPLTADANVMIGSVARWAGDLERAEAATTRGFVLAGSIGDDELALDAAIVLTYTVGHGAARHGEGLVWSHAAEMLMDRLGRRDTLAEARLLNNLGSIRLEQGQAEQARELFARSLALEERLRGGEHPHVAAAIGNLATAQEAVGDHDAAIQGIERSLEMSIRLFGPEHPEVATTLNNLAQLKRVDGDLEAALGLHTRALAMRERVLPPDHPDLAVSLNNLADVHRARGEREQAFDLHTRALAIWERALGPDHPDVALSLNNVALLHQETRAYDQAIALQTRALAILEPALGPDHPTVATAINNLALSHQLRGDLDVAEPLHRRALAVWEKNGGPEQFTVGLSLLRLATIARLRGRPGEALPLFQRALDTWSKVLGPEDPELAWPLVGLGRVALDEHQPLAALPLLERALALRGDDGSKPERLAEARFALARALREAPAGRGRDPVRAGELARQAADAYRELGDTAALAEVEAWLMNLR